ncbi:hypothetical protein CARUB_v10011615mg [Capsella rubella]|uniref:Uncharacterized protein n=1 Tax=Capsella rubella TaxID=81985 RepID=R0IH17_9BRAS|nr:putative protein TPRXL [Capsella rubella]EOA36113.1 hypothetical protein CARUB_v10011615mg [Capsella rubella]
MPHEMDRSRVSTAKLLTLVVDGDYYGGSSAAVPFKWESQPGTPRRFFKRSSLSGFDSDSDFSSPVSSPLTPPPSYFYASPSSSSTTTKPVNPKKANTLFGSLLPKNRSSPSSPVSSSYSTSSSSSSTRSPSSSVPPSPSRTSDSSRRRNRRRSMWSESASSLDYGSSNHYARTSGCYASIVKVLLRDVK